MTIVDCVTLCFAVVPSKHVFQAHKFGHCLVKPHLEEAVPQLLDWRAMEALGNSVWKTVHDALTTLEDLMDPRA